MARLPFTAVALVALLTASLSAAPPISTENPQGTLETRPSSEEQAIAVERMHAQIDEELQRYETNLEKGSYKKAAVAEMKRISGTHTKLRQLGRLTEQLIALRETAGLDWQFRNTSLGIRAAVVVRDYQAVEGTGLLIKQAERAVTKFAEAKADLLEPLGKQLEESKSSLNKLFAVDSRFQDLWDEVEEPLIWQDKLLSGRARGPFVSFNGRLIATVDTARAAQTAEQLAAARAKALPKYEVIEDLVTKSVAAVKENGQAEWAGQMLDGPALIDAWNDGWQKTQVKFLECYALDRLREIPIGETPPSELDQLLEAQPKFEQTMLAGIEEVVLADAARATPEETPELYARYLQAIARLCAQFDEDQLQLALQSSLNQLAHRAPAFAQEVASYEEATGETLRWRRRTAAAYARRYQRGARALDALLTQAAAKDGLANRSTNTDPRIDQLNSAAPPLLLDVAAVTVDMNTFVSHVAPLDAQTSFSRLHDFYFSRIAAATISPTEIAALKYDLLVSENSPPLTLAAAVAIATAESGQFTAVGGQVTGLELEPLLVHFIRNENTAQFAIDLTPDLAKSTVKDLLWQVDLKPTWVQHECIFSKLP